MIDLTSLPERLATSGCVWDDVDAAYLNNLPSPLPMAFPAALLPILLAVAPGPLLMAEMSPRSLAKPYRRPRV